MNRKTIGMIMTAALSLLLVLEVTTSAKVTKPIKLNKKSMTLSEGKKAALKVKTKINTKWKSNNKKVATVKKGIVTAKRAGKAKITAYKGNRKAVCHVIVSKSMKTPSTLQTNAPTPDLTPAPSAGPILPEPTLPEPTPELTQIPIPTSPEPTFLEPRPSPPIPTLEDDFVPGVVMIGFYEPYLAPLTELFPELDMAEIRDTYKESYESCKDNPNTTQAVKDWTRERIGTTFMVKLTQETKESVLEAIDIITRNPLVKYAGPNYRVYVDMPDFYLGIVKIGLYEPYSASLTDLFPELDIAKIEDENERLYDLSCIIHC